MAQEESFQAAEPSDGHMLPARIAANTITTTNDRAAGSSPAPQVSDILDRWFRILAAVFEGIKQQMDFVLKSLRVLWSISLFIGGVIFITYFSSIGFMPEVDVQASITLLTASAATGIMIAITIIPGLVAPSVVWRWWTIPYKTLKPLWSDHEGKPSPWRAALWFGLPLVIFLAYCFCLSLLPPEWRSLWGGLGLILLIEAVVLLWQLPPCFYWRGEGGELHWRKRWALDWKKARAVGIFLVSFLISVFIILLLFLFVDRLIGADPALRSDAVFTAIIAMFFIVVLNAFLLVKISSSVTQYMIVIAMIVLSSFLCLVFLLSSQS